MKIHEVRGKLTELVKVADEALPHIRQGLGPACGKHPTDICARCWADAYFSDMRLAIDNVKDIFTQRWEVDA
jgi:hypothetical protein